MRQTITKLWKGIPRKWKISGLLWVVSFLAGLLIDAIWGVGTLLTVLLIIYAIALVFRLTNLGQFAIEQFWGRIRGMVVSAMFPALWEIIKKLISNPSESAIIEFLFAVLVIVILWDAFGKMIKSLLDQNK